MVGQWARAATSRVIDDFQSLNAARPAIGANDNVVDFKGGFLTSPDLFSDATTLEEAR